MIHSPRDIPAPVLLEVVSYSIDAALLPDVTGAVSRETVTLKLVPLFSAGNMSYLSWIFDMYAEKSIVLIYPRIT